MGTDPGKPRAKYFKHPHMNAGANPVADLPCGDGDLFWDKGLSCQKYAHRKPRSITDTDAENYEFGSSGCSIVVEESEKYTGDGGISTIGGISKRLSWAKAINTGT